MTLARIAAAASSIVGFLTMATSAFAQFATDSAVVDLTGTGGGATDSALPDAGTIQITYIIFIAGLVLFLVAMMRMLLAFRDSNS
ncbi:hypothetical protein HY382_00110 [Candidatus Curtissbacteria bacterium]|nr:hypothetical protein [Candidatus Curtissbacteria bacterium]